MGTSFRAVVAIRIVQRSFREHYVCFEANWLALSLKHPSVSAAVDDSKRPCSATKSGEREK